MRSARAQENSRASIKAYDEAINEWRREYGQTLLAACYYGRAQSHCELGDFEACAEDASGSLAHDEGNLKAFKLRGWARFHLGLYRKAATDFKMGIEMGSGDAESYLDLGRARMRLGSIRLAAIDFHRAEAIAPLDARPFLEEAVLREREKQWDKARPLYERADDLSGHKSLRALAGLGFCDSARKDFEKSLERYSSAIEIGATRLNDFVRTQAPDFKKSRCRRRLSKTYFRRGMVFKSLNRPNKYLADERKSCELGYLRACAAMSVVKKRRAAVSRKSKTVYLKPSNSGGERIYAQ
ncbi:MAG: tetratricopeptide repeat protein [Elusimicrobiota bacterium]